MATPITASTVQRGKLVPSSGMQTSGKLDKVGYSYFFMILFGGVILRYLYPTSGSIVGYNLMLIAVVCILFNKLIDKGHLFVQETSWLKSIFGLIYNIIGTNLHLFILLLILMNLTYIYSTYSEVIEKNRIPRLFNTFSFYSLFFIIVQAALLFKDINTSTEAVRINDDGTKMSTHETTSLTPFMTIISVLNVSLVSIMYVIIKLFRTDG